MFRNYFKITVRGFLKSKAFTFINVLGLAIGIACCLLIMLWVQNELSYDSFVKNKGNIYRVVQEVDHAGERTKIARTPATISDALKADYPEVTKGSQYWIFDFTFNYGDNEYDNRGALVAPDFLDMFSVKFISGDPATALANTQSIVLTKSMAEKIFGDKNPIGETLRLGDEDLNVTAVIKDYPHNSHLNFDFLQPFELIYKWGFPRDGWRSTNNPLYNYVQIENLKDIKAFNNKIEKTIFNHYERSKSKVFVQPLEDVHLYSNFRGDVERIGNIDYVYISIAMGIFVLLIACFNFMNLSTAKASTRLKEIGIRKVIGAFRKDLVSQFLGEAFVVTVAGFFLGLTFIAWILPEFNSMTSKNMELDFLNNPTLLWGSVGIILFSALLSGSYPAFVLSSFQPADVLKGPVKSKISGSSFRRVLVVVQFSLSIAITIGMLVTNNQIDFIRTKWLGFDRENLLYFEMNEELRGNYEAFENRLSDNPSIKNLSKASHLLTDVTHIMGSVEWQGKNPDEEIIMNCLLVDDHFVSALDMKLVKGRDFSEKFVGDKEGSIILNETAVKKMGFTNPIGQIIKYGERQSTVVGVVNDFHFKPLQSTIEPMVMINSDREELMLYIRIDGNDIKQTLASIGEVWASTFPETTYDPRFVDAELDKMYENEKQVQSMFGFFTLLAIIVSCMGLFGLASFMAEKRTKEIGIRKTLGATVPNVVVLLSREFTMWVLVANLIAWPSAYIFMQQWLEGFAYRSELNFMFFIAAGLSALLIAWITVAFQSIKAALANPVDSLKYE